MSKKALNHLKKDKTLKKAIDQASQLSDSQHMTGDVYFDLIRSIAYQQLHANAAGKIFDRFLELFEDSYPHPEQVLELQVSDLRAVGFSNQKGGYIQNIADFAIEEKMHRIDWDSMSDQEIISLLSQIKGVGVWTVQMVLMSSLQRPDVFPVGDYGIQQAIILLYSIDSSLKGKALSRAMEEVAETWSPYRSLACRYLWNWKDEN